MISSTQAARYARTAALALALALPPAPAPGQAAPSRRDEVVWHWFGTCAGADSLALDVHLDGEPIYSVTFPICKTRRAAIKPEPEQRLIAFRFDAAPRRFGMRDPSTDLHPIAANIWQARGERSAIVLGVSYATTRQVLLNTMHVAQPDAVSRSERVRGLVITTHPVRHR